MGTFSMSPTVVAWLRQAFVVVAFILALFAFIAFVFGSSSALGAVCLFHSDIISWNWVIDFLVLEVQLHAADQLFDISMSAAGLILEALE